MEVLDEEHWKKFVEVITKRAKGLLKMMPETANPEAWAPKPQVFKEKKRRSKPPKPM